ncbi:MAG: nitrilase-related carbon-nitrogen hydrolase [Candidatus Dormibacteria bacterium]
MAVDQRVVTEPQARPVTNTRASGGFTAALAQIAPRLGDVPRNLERHLSVLAEAREHGADVVVFPELSLTGYFLKDLVPDVALRLDSDEIGTLVNACRDVDAVVGCVIETEDARFLNACLYIAQGAIRQLHAKVYLPTYGIFDEQRYMAPGDRFRAFDAGVHGGRRWRAGILVCEDMWHPTAPALLARQGVDVFLCSSASPGRGVLRGAALGTAQSYDVMTRTYAQLFTAYVVYCNRVGYEDGIAFWGGSRVVGPDGVLAGEPAGSGETVSYHRLEKSAVRRARIAYPVLSDERHDVNDAETERLRSRRSGD